MPTRAARNDAHCSKGRELARLDLHLIEKDAARLLSHAAQNRVPNGTRLLKDFFEHEMLVAALLRHDGIPENVRYLALDRASGKIGQRDAVPSERSYIAILKKENVARGG